jgi:hypothetical protein
MGRDRISPEERSERQVETVSALLQAARGHRMNAVVLNKAMFYADLVALRDLGHTMSGSEYNAAPLGPMLANFDTLKVVLSTRGVAEQTFEEDTKAEPVCLRRPLQAHFLTEAEKEVAWKVGAECSKWSSTQATDIAHLNPGWKLAFSAPRKRINLLIAMQQIIDDAWIKEPATPEELEAAGRGVSEVDPWE